MTYRAQTHTKTFFVFLTLILAILATLSAPARGQFIPEPVVCDVEAESMVPADMILENFGDRVPLELIVLVQLDGICAFEQEWIDITVGSHGQESDPVFLEPLVVEVLSEKEEELLRLSYRTAVIAQGPGRGTLDARYDDNLSTDASLLAESRFESTAEAPPDGGCFVAFGQYDPRSVLFERAGEIADLSLEVEVFKNERQGCDFRPEEVKVALEASSEVGTKFFALDALAPVTVVDTPEYSRYLYRATVMAEGEVGSAAVVARYENPDSTIVLGARARRSNLAFADLVPGAMALDAASFQGYEIFPEPPPFGEDPYLLIDLEVDEEELEAMRNGTKNILVLAARDHDRPGGVFRILEVGEPGPSPSGQVLVEVLVQILPAAKAFDRYRVDLQTEPIDVPLHDNPAGEPIFKTPGDGSCDFGNTNQINIELLKLTGNFFEVTPELSIEIVEGELQMLKFVAHQVSNFQLEGPKLTINGTFGGLQAECTLELLEIELPLTVVSGPFVFNPTVSAEVGVTMEALAGAIDIQIHSFDFKYWKTESHGFIWSAEKGAEPIQAGGEPTYEATFLPNPQIEAQTLDLAMKFTPFFQLRLGIKARFLGVEVGTLKLVNVRAGLETTVRLPVWTFLVDAPSPDWENPKWKVEALVNVTVDPSVEWSPYLERLGAKDWESSFPPINLLTLSLIFGEQPDAVLESPATTYFVGEPIPVTARLEHFWGVLDRAFYRGRTVDFYLRTQGESTWEHVGSSTVAPLEPDLAAVLDVSDAITQPGDVELIAVVREPLVDDLQFPILTLTIDSFDGSFTPDFVHLQAGLDESTEAAVKIFNSNETTSLNYRFKNVPSWIHDLVSGTVDPDKAASEAFTAHCGSTAENRYAVLDVETTSTGGSWTKLGELDVSLDCRAFTVAPTKLRFELAVGETRSKTFTITNETAASHDVSVQTTENPALDTTDHEGTFTLAANVAEEVEVTVSCDKPGTREGWLTLSSIPNNNSPWALVYTEIECQPEGDDGNGGSAGDPHLLTLDGKRYDFQARGEYVLARYDDATYGFEVQTRQAKATPQATKNVTLNKAAAMDVDGVTVSFYSQGHGNELEVRVGGNVRTMADPSTISLASGGEIERRGATYWVSWPAMAGGGVPVAVVRDHEKFLNVQVYPPSAMAGQMLGLLGDFDGDAGDEPFRSTAAKDPVDPDQIYCFDPACFAYGSESWLVGAASLFDYAPGEGPEDHTPASGDPIPTDEPSVDDYTAAEVDWAIATCLTGGAVDVLEPCVLDLLVTRDPSIALANAELASPTSWWRAEGVDRGETGSSGDFFGHAVAIDGDLMAIGNEDIRTCGGVTCFLGSMRIFERVSGVWTKVYTEAGHSSESSPKLAFALGIEGGTVYAGVPGDHGANGTTWNAGAVRIYQDSGTGWGESAAIANPDDSPMGDRFGSAIAVDSSHLAVGAPGDDNNTCGGSTCSDAGAIFIRLQPSGGWQKLVPSGSEAEVTNAYFGTALALDGDRLAVGAPGWGGGAGAVFLYRKAGSSWVWESTWTGFAGSRFGAAVSLAGDRLAVGAPDESGGTDTWGAVHVYADQSGMWTETSWLVPADGLEVHYGEAVVLAGTNLFIGAPSMNLEGQLYVLDARPGAPGGFSPALVLDIPAPEAGNDIGAALAISGGTLAVGAPGAGGTAGAAYVLDAE